MTRPLGLILLVASLAPCAFGLWGLFSDPGRRRFDEMAGIIPVAALLLGSLLALAGAGLALLTPRRRPARPGFGVVPRERPGDGPARR